MKRLYLVRHGKSHWDCDWLSDFERPIAARGKREAPGIARALRANGPGPDLILSSPATRTYQTARIVSAGLGYDPQEIVLVEGLYEAMTRDVLEVISRVESSVEGLMIVGHNPATTSVANRLTNAGIDNVPTSGMVIIDYDTVSWKEAATSIGKLVAYEYPKKM